MVCENLWDSSARAVRPYQSSASTPQRAVDCCLLINHTDYFLTQTAQIYAEAIRGSLYIMETFAERAHSACALPSGRLHTSEAMYVFAKSFIEKG